ncbi:unnamed protein product [Allacma fusca]|uniref:Cytochrome P450 n=1 Tax=Allacma fusca TaxID=39272 RepID=A0A8J2JMB4_9HEXA|nr:unnamed protein product [Allacma fusca]
MMILVGIVCILLYIISTHRQRKYRLPPGPWSFPIVGNLQWLQKFPWIYLSTLGKTYGPIATIKFGRARVFLLNDIETWKEAFRREEFSRQPGKIFEAVLKNKSIIFGDGNPEIKRKSHYYLGN